MLLQVNQVSKSYPKTHGFLHRTFSRDNRQFVLQNINFQQTQGESLGLLGQSGSGKSTLARLICGIEKADSGDILLDGQNVSERQARQGKISLVLQDYISSINPTMQVWQAVSEPLWQQDLSLSQQRENVALMLEKVGLSPDIMHRYAAELSGGQAQRVAICRALIHRPKLIVLDEPTSSLDIVNQVQLLDLLLQLKSEFQLSYFFISHNIQVLCYLCDRLMWLEQGQIAGQCAVQDLGKIENTNLKEMLQGSI